MKLKVAKKLGKAFGHSYIAVDKNREIWSYSDKPSLHRAQFWSTKTVKSDLKFVGLYSGTKKWNKTRRKVN